MPFIVLEGLDGAGKSTQIKQLSALLDKLGRTHEYIHFPRFDTPVYGDLIARFLRGEFGSAREVNPYLVALIYAGDREKAAPMIRSWLADGRFVIVDRYVCSNIAYQCAKAPDDKKKALREWILDLEYAENKIPRPDITLFLDVPLEFTERNLNQSREGCDRDYLKGQSDIHEASMDLQRAVRAVYLAEPDLKIIDCSDGDGKMLPPDETFEKIYDKIKYLL